MSDLSARNNTESNPRIQELIDNFRERETREGYAQGFLHTWISSQLATVRGQRGLTQKKLAELIGTQQPGVARMERDDYGKWKLETLEKVAAALDCRLKVSLETYGSLIEEIVALTSPEYLERPDFAHDPFIDKRYAAWSKLDAPGPVGSMRRKLADWLEHGTSPEQLNRWLGGQDLPPVGDDLQPSDWLLRGLEGCPVEESRHVDNCLARLIGDLRKKPESEWADRDLELLSLSRLRPRHEFFEPLFHSYRLRKNQGDFQVLNTHCHTAFLEAIIHNQITAGPCDQIWEYCIGQQQQVRTGVYLGLKGFAFAPERPNAWDVVNKGLQLVNARYRGMNQEYSNLVDRALTQVGEELNPTFTAELAKLTSEPNAASEGTMRAVARYSHRQGFTGDRSTRNRFLAAAMIAVPRPASRITI